jgi:hypothetical protein
MASNQQDRTELLRRQVLARREETAANAIGQGSLAPAVQSLSFAAETLQRALPRTLVEQGLIRFDSQGQPRVAEYDPALLAPNPQRGRVLDRALDELAASLNECGQQEPIVARLITDTDRQRWPSHFTEHQLLLIVQGHRLFFAQPRSNLRTLRVELMLPEEGESGLAYARRALRRASIKVMHSQSYDIFDKVNQYMVWRDEFAIERPKDTDVAAYFEISRTEAQRVKAVAQLDPEIAQDILNSERRPADEIVYTIASRPLSEQRETYHRYGRLTVATVRRLERQDATTGKADARVRGAGRPRNYVLRLSDDDTGDIAYVATSLTSSQWRDRGGVKAFLQALRQITDDLRVRQRLAADFDEEALGPTSGESPNVAPQAAV